MFTRIVFSFASFAFVFLFASQVHAQTVDVSGMLTRMQTLMTQMEALQKEFATLQSQLSAAAGSPTVQGAATTALAPVFTESLEYGETNGDIEKIQTLLATDSAIYDHPYVTGLFGPKTEEAIKRLQTRFGLDPVGIIGPATTKLLEGYFRAYPDENYPEGVLSTKPPTVLGAQTSNSGSASDLLALQQQLSGLTSGGSSGTTGNSGNLKEVNVTFDKPESLIEIIYKDGKRKGLVADTTDRAEVVTFVADSLSVSEAVVNSVIAFSGRSSSRSDADEDDAEEALDDADDAIDEAEEDIEEAEEDGDDVDWAENTLDKAKDVYDEAEEAFEDGDWDEAIELAEEAEDLADDAVDRIDEEEDDSDRGDADEIEEIRVDVDDGESDVTVEYEDGDEYEFTVEEDDEESIIEEVADELDIDEDDVEDLIEFDYGSLDRITVRIDEDDESALVRVFYNSGVERRIRLNETDEDDITAEVADELDEDEEDIEDIIEFDYK